MAGILRRTDLSDDEKREALEDAVDCAAGIETIRAAPRGLVSAGIAMEVAWSALFLGLRAGLSPDDIERLRREATRSWQSEAGSGRGKQRRRQRIGLKLLTKEIAKRVRAEDSKASQEHVADAVLERCEADGGKPPGRRTVVRYIAELETKGEIPPRAGLRRT